MHTPTIAVIKEVQRLQDMGLASAQHALQILEAPFGPVDPGHAERFMELRTWQLRQIKGDFDYGIMWDDDHLLEDVPELVQVLREKKADLIYADKVYFWDDPHTITTHMPRHLGVFGWRWYPDDYFPTKFQGGPGPKLAHDRRKVLHELKGKLLDYGYLYREDRERIFREYKTVGKIDDGTVALLAEPQLEPWKGLTFDQAR